MFWSINIYYIIFFNTFHDLLFFFFFFFFNDTATTEIYTLSLHDAVPITSRVSAEASASCDGCVPSTPAHPVVSGWSSGTTALPGSDLTIGLPSTSATASSSFLAPVPPTPTSTATRRPPLSTAAARSSSAADGTPGAGTNTGAVGGVDGVMTIQGPDSAAAGSRFHGKLMCETEPRAMALPMPMSTTAGICTGTWTRTL